MSSGSHSECQNCGASVYREHLDSGIARYEDGKLMCAHCVTEYERTHDGVDDPNDDSLAPIEFDTGDDELTVDMSSTRIHNTAADSLLGAQGVWDDSHFKRPLGPPTEGATRCRVFHSKLSEAALGFMNTTINEWLDQAPSINIKFATSTIGQFEGKQKEPNIILTMFY